MGQSIANCCMFMAVPCTLGFILIAIFMRLKSPKELKAEERASRKLSKETQQYSRKEPEVDTKNPIEGSDEKKMLKEGLLNGEDHDETIDQAQTNYKTNLNT